MSYAAMVVGAARVRFTDAWILRMPTLPPSPPHKMFGSVTLGSPEALGPLLHFHITAGHKPPPPFSQGGGGGRDG